MNKTKEAIYNASIDIFSRCGYTGASMDDIAVSAGVAKGTLYYHFKSKEELFLFAMQTGLNHLIDDARGVLQKSLKPEEKLRALCVSQLKAVSKSQNFIKVVISQLFGQEERQQLLRGELAEYSNLIKSCIFELDAASRTQQQADAAAIGFLGMLSSLVVFCALHPASKKSVEAILLENYLHGIL